VLPLAHLIEMADERILADGLRGQVQVLELVQLRSRRPSRSLGVLRGTATRSGAGLREVRRRARN